MFASILTSAIRFSTIFTLGSTGETLTEKSGNLNLGIPGIMCAGAIGGIIGENIYIQSLGSIAEISAFGAIVTPLIFSMIFSGLLGAFYCLLTVTLKCNQNVTGLAITTFGAGLLSLLGNRIDKTGFAQASLFFTDGMDFASKLGGFGQVVFSHGFMVYFAIILAIIVAIIIKRTRTGLSLQAVGENPATADAAGLSVTNYKYVATIIGSMIAGFGGVFYIFDYLGGSIEYTIEAYGWLAIAIVIFSVWKPNFGIFSSLIFGFLYILPYYTQVNFAQMELIKMVPYVVTILVLIVTSIMNRKESQPPAALGLTYFREER